MPNGEVCQHHQQLEVQINQCLTDINNMKEIYSQNREQDLEHRKNIEAKLDKLVEHHSEMYGAIKATNWLICIAIPILGLVLTYLRWF